MLCVRKNTLFTQAEADRLETAHCPHRPPQCLRYFTDGLKNFFKFLIRNTNRFHPAKRPCGARNWSVEPSTDAENGCLASVLDVLKNEDEDSSRIGVLGLSQTYAKAWGGIT